MSKTIPTVMKYMTTTPHSISVDESIRDASRFMSSHHIRHLPVTQGTELRGIVSDRDIKMALGMNGVDPALTKVSDVAFEDPYLISPDSKLDEVVAAMAEKKIGSALVVDHNKLVGIFTTTDALRALSELLQSRLTH